MAMKYWSVEKREAFERLEDEVMVILQVIRHDFDVDDDDRVSPELRDSFYRLVDARTDLVTVRMSER